MPSTHSEREKRNELSKEATVHVPEIFVVHHICNVQCSCSSAQFEIN